MDLALHLVPAERGFLLSRMLDDGPFLTDHRSVYDAGRAVAGMVEAGIDVRVETHSLSPDERQAFDLSVDFYRVRIDLI